MSIINAYIVFCCGVFIKHYGNIDLYYEFKKYLAIMGVLTFLVPLLISGIRLIWSDPPDAVGVAVNVSGFLEIYLFSLLGALIGDFFTALLISIVDYLGYDL